MCSGGNSTGCAWSVFPQIRRLRSGALVLTGGRAGLFLWVNADGTARSWTRVNLAAAHNRLLAAQPELLFSEACVNITGPYQPRPDVAGTTSYTGMAVLDDADAILVSYDRLANGWHYPPGPYGTEDRVFTMRIHIDLTR